MCLLVMKKRYHYSVEWVKIRRDGYIMLYTKECLRYPAVCYMFNSSHCIVIDIQNSEDFSIHILFVLYNELNVSGPLVYNWERVHYV